MCGLKYLPTVSLVHNNALGSNLRLNPKMSDPGFQADRFRKKRSKIGSKCLLKFMFLTSLTWPKLNAKDTRTAIGITVADFSPKI